MANRIAIVKCKCGNQQQVGTNGQKHGTFICVKCSKGSSVRDRFVSFIRGQR